MSHYKPYPAYKDSGVEWLGAVPADWKPTTLSYLADYFNGYPFAPEQWSCEGIPIVRIAQLTGKPFDNFYDGAAPEHLRVEDGDLLFSWSATIDCFIWDRGPAWLNQHIFRVLPSKEADKRFLYHLLRHVAPKLADFDAHGSTMRHIKKESLKERIFVPSLSTQVAIAAHLDRETARIDALITKKTRFIELLREKRQALITHAVTKGLDPNVPMKDSGVEWLGEVPEHWAVCKLSFRYAVELGKMLDEKRIDGKNLMPYLRNQDVQWDAINTQNLPEMDIYPSELSRYTVCAGDLLVCEGGDVGRAAIWRGNGDETGFQKALHRLRPRSARTDTAEFFFFSLMTAKVRGVFEESDAKATIAHLPAEKFRQYRFAFPPQSEQYQISAYLREQTARLDTLMEKTTRSIDLIKERRSALITAAVTGLIDLREAA